MMKRNRLKYSEIARALGISRSHASRIARGLRNPSMQLLETARKKLGAKNLDEALRMIRGK